MNFRRISDGELADFADNVVTLLSGTELSAIDSGVRAQLVAAFGAWPATLAARSYSAMIAEDVKRSQISEKDEANAMITGLLSQVNMTLKASGAPRDQFELAGFDYPTPPVRIYVARDPTELSVVGFSNGVNRGKFSGNNRYSAVTYDIWRRDGKVGVWAPRIITKKQSFDDIDVIPGQFYEYRVRAIASRNVSNYSNPAPVYGAM